MADNEESRAVSSYTRRCSAPRNSLHIVATGEFADRLRALFDRMLASERLMHLNNHRGCGLYLVNLGAQKIQEELERDE